jgi:DNA-directed RNA polymerase specialized sigma24 family protein
MPWLRTVATRVGIDANRRQRPDVMDHDELVELAPSVPDETAEVTIRVLS